MAQQGINPKQIKSYNDTALLYLLSSEGTLSRKAISAKLGLTAAAVSKITKRLIDCEKIEELGVSAEDSERVGRKEVLLSLKSADKFCLGITAELDTVTYALCDVSGKLIKSISYDFFDDTDLIVEKTKEFLHSCGELQGQLIGIGLCVVGSVKKDVFGVWDNEALCTALERELQLPVAIQNNVKAYALAELIFGDVSDVSSVLFFKWGNGIGSAVAVGGKLLLGTDYSLTEVGHYIVDPAGKRCRCGRFGCLETVASSNVISAETGLSLDDVVESEDERIIHILEQKIDTVALALTNTATILNANKIVLFGKMFENSQIVEKLARQCARYNNNFKNNKIMRGDLSAKSAYIGAAAVCAQQFFFTENE
ncbi:MAG: ROK family transcriptional regulator [Clostridia bacterium]|nr:ROK family transcriptional regulator [Clostridia bacterium]